MSAFLNDFRGEEDLNQLAIQGAAIGGYIRGMIFRKVAV